MHISCCQVLRGRFKTCAVQNLLCGGVNGGVARYCVRTRLPKLLRLTKVNQGCRVVLLTRAKLKLTSMPSEAWPVENVISEVHHVHYLSILRATLLWLCSSVRVSSECLFITKFWKRTERRRSRRWDVTFQIQGLNVETRVGTYQWQLNAK